MFLSDIRGRQSFTREQSAKPYSAATLFAHSSWRERQLGGGWQVEILWRNGESIDTIEREKRRQIETVGYFSILRESAKVTLHRNINCLQSEI